MDAFGRVEKKGRCAGGGHCGGNLLADQPGLAHSGNDQTPLTGENQFHRPAKLAINPVMQSQNGIGFNFQGIACNVNDGTGRVHRFFTTASKASSDSRIG